ncbi:MAG: DUF2357 domain-containing protein [Erysipelotrichaceae bacterium]|nr:DUF2357 domain-containing protein [Erysipelotrichaceae bacterium]
MNKDEYLSYLDRIKELFIEDVNFNRYLQDLNSGKSSFQINQKYLRKVFDHDWIDIIEEILPSLDAIVRNPRRFITVEEDIIDISLAKQISVESVKHLAQHTQFISSANPKTGSVTPSKILNTSKEESYEVYENRFIFTLLKKLQEFINKRYEAIKKSVVTNNMQEIKVIVNSKYKHRGNDMNIRLEASTDVPFDENKFSESSDYLTIERVKKMKNIVDGFLSSAFAREMRSSAPVRPPITRTNVIKKEPNFKKALILWQFIESYEKSGFDVEKVDETSLLPEDVNDQYKQLLFINDLIVSSFSALQDGDNSLLDISNKIKDQVQELEQEKESSEDDFPLINLELREVRKVYIKSNGDKVYSPNEYRELTAAMDRVITQYQVLQAKKDEKLKKALIEKQKKEDARVKAKNLRDKKLEIARRKKEEELAVSLLKKEEQAKIREAKRAQLEFERANKERQKLQLQQLMEQHEMDEVVDEYRKLLEAKMNKELVKYEVEEDSVIELDKNNLEIDFENEIEEFKKEQVEKFKQLLDQKIEEINKKQYEEV